jgi:hypothetical protein
MSYNDQDMKKIREMRDMQDKIDLKSSRDASESHRAKLKKEGDDHFEQWKAKKAAKNSDQDESYDAVVPVSRDHGFMATALMATVLLAPVLLAPVLLAPVLASIPALVTCSTLPLVLFPLVLLPTLLSHHPLTLDPLSNRFRFHRFKIAFPLRSRIFLGTTTVRVTELFRRKKIGTRKKTVLLEVLIESLRLDLMLHPLARG